MPNPQQQQSSSVPVAVDRNGELHDTNDIERAPHSLVPPLRCADCGAALEAVRAYPRRDGPRIIHVAAHYRLARCRSPADVSMADGRTVKDAGYAARSTAAGVIVGVQPGRARSRTEAGQRVAPPQTSSEPSARDQQRNQRRQHSAPTRRRHSPHPPRLPRPNHPLVRLPIHGRSRSAPRAISPRGSDKSPHCCGRPDRRNHRRTLRTFVSRGNG
jgi:hypothetical protein